METIDHLEARDAHPEDVCPDTETKDEIALHKNETNPQNREELTPEERASLHVRNANSRTIFKNPTLACQFLKGYLDLPIFANLKPEDIEDVTNTYQAYLGIEFETDTVKRIRLNINGVDREIFVISLIDHKSYVDYDVSMQLLRYMVTIWHEFAKKKNREKEFASIRKSFRYPLIIPIVYYEGAKKWTADLHFHNRIECWKYARKLVPDFTYRVVRIHDYTNETLAERNDEISLAFLINKIQNEKDYTEFLNTSREFVSKVYRNAPEDIRKIFQDIL
ncbi:MAG: Rpn family recombination-promoting nuclease/putative transposase [Lachnospiraceae bacterium]|nr:Rpn family recombination-promoting nuclease/putative transposase [Lachnospiraceae bacterium]